MSHLAELTRKIGEAVDPQVRAWLAQVVAELEEQRERLDSAATRQEFAQLAEAQRRTEERLAELAEAQQVTEVRLAELAEAQRRTEERLEQLTARVDQLTARVEELAQVQRKTEERLDQLTARVDDLTVRLEQLTARVDQLTARVDQLTARVDALAEAQRRTEVAMQEGFRRLQESIAALGSRWGIHNEMVFRRTIEALLAKQGLTVQRGYYGNREVDVVVRNGEHILLEITSQLKMGDVEKLIASAEDYERREGVRPQLMVAASYVSPKVMARLLALGQPVELISYDEE